MELHVARFLALGYSRQRAADEAGCSDRTVERYARRPEFVELVDRLRERAWSKVQPEIIQNVRQALDIRRRVLEGEISDNDSRWKAAQPLLRIVDRVTERALSADLEAAEDAADPGPPAIRSGEPSGYIDVTPSEAAV